MTRTDEADADVADADEGDADETEADADETEADADEGDTRGADTDEDFSYFAKVEEGTVRTTSGRTITEADVVNFAGVSGDFNHHHTDEERMAESMFGQRIAHGMLVLSATTGLLWQDRTPEEREAVVAFYGIDDLRFRAPVFIGDRIHAELEVLEKQEKPGSRGTGTIRYAVDVKKQDATTVLSCKMLSLVE